jgi:hypothetical protein
MEMAIAMAMAIPSPILPKEAGGRQQEAGKGKEMKNEK